MIKRSNNHLIKIIQIQNPEIITEKSKLKIKLKWVLSDQERDDEEEVLWLYFKNL